MCVREKEEDKRCKSMATNRGKFVIQPYPHPDAWKGVEGDAKVLHHNRCLMRALGEMVRTRTCVGMSFESLYGWCYRLTLNRHGADVQHILKLFVHAMVRTIPHDEPAFSKIYNIVHDVTLYHRRTWRVANKAPTIQMLIDAANEEREAWAKNVIRTRVPALWREYYLAPGGAFTTRRKAVWNEMASGKRHLDVGDEGDGRPVKRRRNDTVDD